MLFMLRLGLEFNSMKLMYNKNTCLLLSTTKQAV